MNILIVEDNHINLMTLKSFLQDIGYDPLIAKNGLEGLELWRREKPDIVITDLHMPVMDGFDLIKHLRSEDIDQYTYIIVLTQYDDTFHADQSFEIGADDFLSKPFHKRDLKHRLQIAERILSLQQGSILIYALAKLTQAKDHATGEHLNRVGLYSKVIAQALAKQTAYKDTITHKFINDLYMSCPLHDIGKVGIDDHILKKPGTYTKAEFEDMKKHVTIGYDIIKSIKDKYPRITFLDMGLVITRSHHERFDGKGYPDGLKAKDIPIAARIVALADFYDAMKAERVYKESYSHEEIKAEIVKASKTHFDPDIVQAFLDSEQEFQRLSQHQRHKGDDIDGR